MMLHYPNISFKGDVHNTPTKQQQTNEKEDRIRLDRTGMSEGRHARIIGITLRIHRKLQMFFAM